MIITDDLVYLHIPKTGGTFVEHVMRRVYAEDSRLYIDTSTPADKKTLGVTHQHQTIAEVPDVHQEKDVLMTVRNPYDHYVSSFEFRWWYAHENTVFNDSKISKVYPHYPALSFPEFIVAMNNWELRTVHPSNAKVLDDKNVGFVTWQFIRFVTPNAVGVIRAIDCPEEEKVISDAMSRVTCIPTDSLNSGLYDFLVSRGNHPDDVEFVLNLGKIYPREGGRPDAKSWHSYYTPDLKAIVREKDRLLFRLFPHFDV